ncbi:MAG: hypothetical protein K2M64_04370 [Clostridia bacterium]|nr:hypothetical protein [Clostridia bacterium]
MFYYNTSEQTCLQGFVNELQNEDNSFATAKRCNASCKLKH